MDIKDKLVSFIKDMQDCYPDLYNIEQIRKSWGFSRLQILFSDFLEVVFQPIFKKYKENSKANFYDWLVENRHGEGVFWTDDELRDRVQRETLVSSSEADVIFQNARTCLREKMK